MMSSRLAALLCLMILSAWPSHAQQRPTPPATAPAPAAPSTTAPPAAAPAPAASTPAASTPAPERTTATYGDWTIRCEAQAGPAGTPIRACEASHAVLDPRGQAVAQLVIGRSPTDGGLLAVVQVPVNVTVAEPVRLRAEAVGVPMLTLPFRVCGPRGCFAQAPLPPEDLLRLRQRIEPMQIDYRDAAAAIVALPIGLRGLGVALDSINLDAR